jgi:N-acyl-D-aspartate/D-glutamate deacylase
MTEAEIAIRGGTVIDGSGTPGRRADVGIAGGRVVAIADQVRAPREIDAHGRLVVPGFVDIHTHYDPQVLWDVDLTPSCWHGVTSVVAGNCGYSIAPTRPANRASLLRTLDKVEDMRLATLEAGVQWDFETYGQYLDTVHRRGTAINFGGYVGHTPVRLYVLGDEAYERPATDDEIATMRQVVAESLQAGALGFSSDRAGFHIGDGGRPVPSIAATQEETEALMRVTGDIGQGMIHVAAGENYQWLYDFQRELGRRINWSSILTYPAAASSRGDYRDKLAHHEQGRRDGADVWVQVTCRPIEQQIVMIEPTPFYQMPSFGELVPVPREQRHTLYEDRAWRARALADIDKSGLLSTRWNTLRVVESSAHPELIGRNVASIANERGVAPWDAVCDIALDDKLLTRFNITFANDDEAGVTRLMQAEGCIMGLSDAGAHVGQICDAVMPTDFLANWVRDRQVMPVEQGIRKLSGEIADVIGVDRGYLRVGSPADVVVLDYEHLSPGPLRRVHDMPADGDRITADAPTGIDHILVNGTPIRLDGAPVALDQLPGQILRSTADA